jgi:hypothetical protein
MHILSPSPSTPTQSRIHVGGLLQNGGMEGRVGLRTLEERDRDLELDFIPLLIRENFYFLFL